MSQPQDFSQGLVATLKKKVRQLQDDYAKFNQMRMKQASQSVDSQSYINSGTEVYIVDAKWIEHWKSLCGQQNSQQNQTNNPQQCNNTIPTITQKSNSSSKNMDSKEEASSKSKGSTLTKEQQLNKEVDISVITNQRLIVPKETIICCSEFDNPFNNVLKDDLLLGEDYLLISKDQWNFLEQNYTDTGKAKTFTIRRFYEKLGIGIRTIYVVYYSKKRTWEEFKIRLVKLLKEDSQMTKLIGSLNITKEKLKLWGCNTSALKSIYDQLNEQNSDQNTISQSDCGLGSAAMIIDDQVQNYDKLLQTFTANAWQYIIAAKSAKLLIINIILKNVMHGFFKSELNYKNPLGAQGQLAIAYAKLIKQLWYDDKLSLAPWQFKKTIGKFAKAFNNYEQQDSQELLNFILDGLHEDLNRVLEKPIVPQIESEGLNDEKDSEKSWQNYLKRNQSIIVDLMHGQFKSTVRCPDCDKLSITFDPYMSISLPIPEIKIVEKEYFWVPYDTKKKCVKNFFRFKSHEQIKSLRKLIANMHDVNQEQFELVLIQDDQVKRILPRYEQISALNGTNMFIFAMETSYQSFLQQKQANKEHQPSQQQFFSQVPEENQDNPTLVDWSDKKGANELSKKLKNGYIQTIINPQICQFDDQDISEEGQMKISFEKIFPRLVYLRLNESLIQTHLDIFEYLRPLFTSYLENINNLTSFCKSFAKRKNQVQGPSVIKDLGLWNVMSLNQQYESVFGGAHDPSRKKIEDLPYQINIVSRKVTVQTEDGPIQQCSYCDREECDNCPLPFDDRITLHEYLNKKGISTQSFYYYEDPKTLSSAATSKDSKKPRSGQQPNKRQLTNLEFEIEININSRKFWGLYEILIRFLMHDKVYPERIQSPSKFQQNFFADRVTIDDCFKQFMIPEKLSHQNTWFCNKCMVHKQAVKKIQIFKTPPILILNLKRFKGNQTKQNSFIDFPVRGLDMSEYVISQKQKQSSNLVYDLFAVSNHYGQLLGGHYTAYAKNHDTWFRFNDDQIEEIEDESQIVTNAAYNLFYQRRDLNFRNLNYFKISNFCKGE
ncbi:ubiquitin carboxyl-terminal hydrolase family [Stylonychia lemnae]|uniref:ubiquitinyl hydrolase 1 n=1 Tax=Stylonychia lemnae TaxID=5949 RepID=A0A078ACD5_STYLE|nr:ubiquitin carboxyl-terminal hydrolase family [Stylonychia lemnae]|eukprot:CDW79869.1 ubiquitin carboxyl-terminal hydrolase family [Stylonychia lemnae]